jgi:hypothetical protein
VIVTVRQQRRSLSLVTSIMKLGDVFPNFEADTSEGKIKFWDWSKDS